MDTLLLAPGLHYQQAADELFRKGGEAIVAMVDEGKGPVKLRLDDDAVSRTAGRSNGSQGALKVNNAATAQYIQSIAKPGQEVTLDVGRLVASKGRYKLKRSDTGQHATAWLETNSAGLGWVSHLLYLISPLMTLAAIALLVLFKDCKKSIYLSIFTSLDSRPSWHFL